MPLKSCFAAAIAAVLVVAGMPLATADERPFALVSQEIIHDVDVVKAKDEGVQVVGSAMHIHRDSNIVRYFVSDKNCLLYVANPSKYPDVEKGKKLAYFGFDPVAYWTGPEGVHSPETGAHVAGHIVYYEPRLDATFRFVYQANLERFKQRPWDYVAWVGNHCAGAMAQDRDVPGNPHFDAWVPGVRSHLLFGSYRGWKGFEKKLPEEQTAIALTAQRNFNRRVENLYGAPKVAAR